MFRFDVVVAGSPSQYVLRADPPAGYSIVTDRVREWAVLRWLAGDVAPRARWFLPASGPLGVDAIVTDFIDGKPLAVLAAESSAEAFAARPAICTAAAAIHGRSLDDAPPELAVRRPGTTSSPGGSTNSYAWNPTTANRYPDFAFSPAGCPSDGPPRDR